MTVATTWRNRITGSGVESPDQILANPANWRVHPKHQQDALEGVLNEVGWVQDVIVNQRTGHLVDGHLRVSLALRRGEPDVPVKYVDLTEAEEALVLATIDPLSALAVTDEGKLRELLDEVNPQESSVQKMLDDMARSHRIYEDLIGDDPSHKIDQAELLRERWETEVGDLWQIGEHRLLIGDCTDALVVERLFGERTAELIVTDPPYGVEYVGKTKDALKISNDALSIAPLTPGGCFYVFSPAGDMELVFRLALVDAGLRLTQALVWIKNRFVMGRQDYQWRHESLLYGWKPGAAHRWYGGRRQDTIYDDRANLDTLSHDEAIEMLRSLISNVQTTVWEEDRPSANRLHPTVKPLPLVARAINNSSVAGDIIYDPFLGSGTTMVASESIGRTCFGCEIDPKYAAVILERLSDGGIDPRRLP